MSVGTKGLLKGRIDIEEVANIIKNKFKTEYIRIEKEKDNVYNIEGKEFRSEYGRIFFNYKGDNRILRWGFSTSQSDIKQHDEVNQENIYTQISLGYWGDSEKIITEIVKEYGGYIDKNDCDDIDYEPIEVDSNGNIIPVIHVTMTDIYEKFGAIVVIDK